MWTCRPLRTSQSRAHKQALRIYWRYFIHIKHLAMRDSLPGSSLLLLCGKYFFAFVLSRTQVNLLCDCVRVATMNYTSPNLDQAVLVRNDLRSTFDSTWTNLFISLRRKNCLIEFDYEVGRTLNNGNFDLNDLDSIRFLGQMEGPVNTGKIVNSKQMRRW